MIRTNLTRLLAPLVIALSVSVASAQPAAPAGSDASAQPANNRREKIKQRIRALRAYALTEQLDLDEMTAAKLFPALAKFDDEFDKLLLARADLQKRLAAVGTIKDPKAVDKLIDDAVANQKALWDTEGKRLDQVRKILTPAQTAKLLIVLPAMERKLQNQLRRAALKRQQAEDGDFDKDDDLRDPFESAPRKEKAGAAKKPCDPFEAKHGCK